MSEEPSDATGLRIGLHATFAPGDPASLLAMASEIGYDFVEVDAPRGAAGEPNPVRWPTEAESREAVRNLRGLRDGSGVRMDTFYGGGLWVLRDEDQAVRATGDVACFSRLIPMLAEECGCRVLTVNLAGPLLAPGAAYGELDRNGTAVGTDVHFQRGADALHALGEVAERAGVKIGVEMHGVSLADTGASTLRLIQLTDQPAVGVTWDTGNLITMGRAESWTRQLLLFAPCIVHVHLKNALYGRNRWHRSTLEGGAMEDVAEQVLGLRETGYRGALVVEAPGLKEGRHEMARTDLRFLRSALSRSGGDTTPPC